MPNRRRFLLLAVVLTAPCLAHVAIDDAFAQSTNAFIGTWQLNVPKSTYRPGPKPKSGVLKVEYSGNMRKSVFDSVTADGSQMRSEYAAPEDGKDYPLKGNPNADMLALRRVAPGTIARIDKRRGQVVMVMMLRLSGDGKTMTVTQEGVTGAGEMVNNTLLFEKR